MERVSRRPGGGHRPAWIRSNVAEGAPNVARPGPGGADPMRLLARLSEGRGAGALRHEIVRDLQRIQGNRATAGLLGAESGRAHPPPPSAGGAGIAIARDHRTPVKVTGGRNAREEGTRRRAGALTDFRSRAKDQQ